MLTLRNLDDVDRIKARVDAGAKRVVVIGAGFIGLSEAAAGDSDSRPQSPTLRLEPFCFGGYFCNVVMCRPSRSITSLYKYVFCWVRVARGPGA